MPLHGLDFSPLMEVNQRRRCSHVLSRRHRASVVPIGKRLIYATTRYVLKDQQHLLNELYRTSNYPIDFEKNVILPYREKFWHVQAYGNICSTIPCLLNDPHLLMGAI